MEHKSKLNIKDIALIGLMVAIIEVCKVTMAHIPNVELTTFWLMMFTLFLGKRVYYVIPVFIIIEGLIYGFGLWWIMYLYLWPLVVVVTRIFRKDNSIITFSMISGIFGLLFGFFGAIPYIFVGAFEGGLANGFKVATAWWIAGIPWDLVHGISNFIIMLVLYHPIANVMKKARKYTS
jgi:energy-coupling factor transport system substrate-specific component